VDSKLATSFFLGRHSVYGFALKPFCLLHSLQLEALGSPLLDGREVTSTDLVIAAQVCSRHDRFYRGYSKALFRRIRYNFDAELAKFRLYLAESRACFDLYDAPSEGGRGPLRSPWQQAVVTFLIRKAKITRAEAWLMPEGEALCLFYSIREQENGKSDIYSEEEQQSEAEELRDREENAELYALRLERFTEYTRRKAAGTWPHGKLFDHDEELPPEGAN